MKSTYVSLIALTALFVVSQAQAMQPMQLRSNEESVQLLMKKFEEKYNLLMKKTEEKYNEAIRRAGTNRTAITDTLNVHNGVVDKISQYYHAIKTYEVELAAEKINPNYNPLTSDKLKRVNETSDDALRAYRNAYGELTE